MHLLVTRPEDDAGELVAALKDLGHRVLCDALLRIAPVPGVQIPEADYQAVLVTSANGVRALELTKAGTSLKTTPVLAVGEASARAARAAGFGSVAEAAGDLEALQVLVNETMSPAGGPLLYAAGRVVSGDLKGRLEASGFTVERAVLYEAVPASHLSAETIDALRDGALDGVLLYSPRTARIWLDLTVKAGLGPLLATVTHFCLSQAVADVIGSDADAPDAPMLIASRPNQADMLALISSL